MIAREQAKGEADDTLMVALSIDDVDLAVRVRRMLADDPGIHIVDGGGFGADLRITDSAAEFGAGVPVLVLSTGVEALDALQGGAAAILPDDSEADTVKAAIRAAARGLTVFTGEMRDRLFGRSDSDGLERAEDELSPVDLTERELQVLALLAEGASNKSIARSLAITPHTAKFHVASIIAKLGATGRTEAVAKAMRTGLLMI